MKVAFIGLGSMGAAMAGNLIKAGHGLVVYNRTRSRAEDLRAMGAVVAGTPGEAATGVEVLITMLADDNAVEDSLLGPGRALQTLPADAIHLGMSTISVVLSRRLAGAHREKRQYYVAAPVFGRPDAAAAGKLFIVASGPSKQIERCQPLFDAVGQKTFMIDEEPATANVVELTGNFLITTAIESLAEALAVVRKAKVDPDKFLEIITGSLFAAPVFRNYGGMIAKGQFEPVGFTLPLGFKDNRLILALAEETSTPMPMASLIHDRFLTAMAQGLSDADWSAIARISFRNAGLEEAA
jgi:3-hydroxyisobutyrate dehydrogenase-like beta-hydroxyacid dehydrogenase